MTIRGVTGVGKYGGLTQFDNKCVNYPNFLEKGIEK
jgi:hypothetical protein